MSEQYDNTNSGALFKNRKKEHDKHPDYNGSLDCEGTEYWVSAWINTSRNGEKYMKLRITKKDTQPTLTEEEKAQLDEDIPF